MTTVVESRGALASGNKTTLVVAQHPSSREIVLVVPATVRQGRVYPEVRSTTPSYRDGLKPIPP